MSKKQKLSGSNNHQVAIVDGISTVSYHNRVRSGEWGAKPAATKKSRGQAEHLQIKYDQRCSQKRFVIKLTELLEKTETKLNRSVSKNLELVSEELRRGTNLASLLQEQAELSQLPFEQEILKFCRNCRHSLTTLILSISHDIGELGKTLGGDPKVTATNAVDMRVAELDSVSIEQKLMDNESQIGWLETIISTGLSNSVSAPRTQHLIYANEISQKIYLRLLSLKHRLIFYFCDSVRMINPISFARLKALYETNERALARLQDAVAVLQKIQTSSGLIITRKMPSNRCNPFTFKIVASSMGNSSDIETGTDESEINERVSGESSESSRNFIQVISSQCVSTSQEDIHFSDLSHSDVGIDESDGFAEDEIVVQSQVIDPVNVEPAVRNETMQNISQSPDLQNQDSANDDNTVDPVLETLHPSPESLEEQMSIESQEGRLNVDVGESESVAIATEECPQSMVVRLYTGISHVLTKSAQSAKNVISNVESFVATGAADLDQESSNNDEVMVPPPVVPLSTAPRDEQHVDTPQLDANPPAKRYRLSLSREPVGIRRTDPAGGTTIPPSVEPTVRREIVVSDNVRRRAGPSRTHKTAQPLRLAKKRSSPEPHLVPPEGEQQDESLRKVLRRLFDIVQNR